MVVLFILAHPGKRFSACLKLITKRESRQICVKFTIKAFERNCKNKGLSVNMYMVIVHQRNFEQSLT